MQTVRLETESRCGVVLVQANNAALALYDRPIAKVAKDHNVRYPVIMACRRNYHLAKSAFVVVDCDWRLNRQIVGSICARILEVLTGSNVRVTSNGLTVLSSQKDRNSRMDLK
jgi:hypothetical protein